MSRVPSLFALIMIVLFGEFSFADESKTWRLCHRSGSEKTACLRLTAECDSGVDWVSQAKNVVCVRPENKTDCAVFKKSMETVFFDLKGKTAKDRRISSVDQPTQMDCHGFFIDNGSEAMVTCNEDHPQAADRLLLLMKNLRGLCR